MLKQEPHLAPFSENKTFDCEKQDFIPGFDTPLQYLNKYMETDIQSIDRHRRLECLKMAVQHATPEQFQTGKVYDIARDYLNWVING